MATTKDDIRAWLRTAQDLGATHMLVVCDTYDYTDYPVYVEPDQDVKLVMEENSGPNMTRLMEVYNLSMPTEAQLEERRAWHP